MAPKIKVAPFTLNRDDRALLNCLGPLEDCQAFKDAWQTFIHIDVFAEMVFEVQGPRNMRFVIYEIQSTVKVLSLVEYPYLKRGEESIKARLRNYLQKRIDEEFSKMTREERMLMIKR